jgi:hypothetical protein
MAMSANRVWTVLTPLAAALGLAGCANMQTAYRTFQPDMGQSVAIDAKQRVVYTVQKDYGEGKEWRAICAEPSPDVLSALSATAGLDASAAAKAIGLAFSSQEGAASIGLRTQTIQTLRDAMYRLCEGYASGAIDDTGFTRLQRRYQAVMLGLLAIEQLTGAVVAQQATLSGSGSARLGQSLVQISVLVTEAQTKKATTAADLALKKADTEAKKKAAETAKKTLDDATTTEARDKATKELTAANKAQTDAEEAQRKSAIAATAAEKDLESLETLRKEADRAAAIGGVTAALAPAQAASSPDVETRKEVAQRVESIVKTIVAVDYTRETCLDTVLSRNFRDAINPSKGTVANRSAEGAQTLAALQLRFCAYAMEQTALSDLAQTKSLTKGDSDAMRSLTDSLMKDLNLRNLVPFKAVPRTP